jgi:hypothetical protein
MTLAHTPGPWTADDSGLITAGPRRLHIAQAATTGMSHAAEANARTLAAAPDLLEALQRAQAELDLLHSYARNEMTERDQKRLATEMSNRGMSDNQAQRLTLLQALN